MSRYYERMNFVTSFGFSILWRKQFIEKLKKTNAQINVIELLSGLGENWNFLTKHFSNANMYALGFSDAMILKSQENNLKKFDNRIRILKENLL